MRFMILVKATRDSEAGVMPSPQLMTAMADYHGQPAKAGVLLDGNGLQPGSKGWRIRYEGGRRSMVDGPFTEAKELIAGFALMEVSSREQAIEEAKKFLEVAGEGECEIRQIFTASERGPGDAAAHHAELHQQFVNSGEWAAPSGRVAAARRRWCDEQSCPTPTATARSTPSGGLKLRS